MYLVEKWVTSGNLLFTIFSLSNWYDISIVQCIGWRYIFRRMGLGRRIERSAIVGGISPSGTTPTIHPLFIQRREIMEKNSFLYFLMIFSLFRAFCRRVCGNLSSDILPSLHRLVASQCKPCALCQNCLNVMYHVSSIKDDSSKRLQLVHGRQKQIVESWNTLRNFVISEKKTQI